MSAPDATRLLAALLDEVIFVVDAEGRVPHDIVVERADSTECTGTMRTVPLASVTQTGSVPKSVSLSELRVEEDGDRWSCRVLVDI